MEESVHYILVILQTMDGIYIQKVLAVFKETVTLQQCMNFVDGFLREDLTVYYSKENLTVMKDGSGYRFGYECVQDPNRM